MSTDRARHQHLQTFQEGAVVGHYALPAKLATALAAEATIRQQALDAKRRQAAVIGADGVVSQLSDAIVEAARTGSPMPDVAQAVEAAEAAERRAATEVAVWSAAATTADDALLRSVSGETIINESLKPAHAATLADLARLAPKLAPYTVAAPERMLQAPAEARKAFADLIALADRYEALQTAHVHASRMSGGPREDHRDDFAEFSNPAELYGDRWAARAQFQLAPPWPENRLERLLWLQASQAEPWMPTIAEQDAAALADREAGKKRTRHALRPVGVAVG